MMPNRWRTIKGKRKFSAIMATKKKRAKKKAVKKSVKKKATKKSGEEKVNYKKSY